MDNSSHGKKHNALRQKAQEFLSSRKHANNLVDIINYWDEATIACILQLENVFTEILRRGDMCLQETISLRIQEPSAETVYIDWLRNCFDQFWEKLYSSMEDSRTQVQVEALSAGLKLLAEEGRSPIEPLHDYFPTKRLEGILMRLLSMERDNEQLMCRFQEMANYPDALQHSWRCLPKFTSKGSPKPLYIKNLLNLIHKMAPPKETESESFGKQECLCGPETNFKWDYPKVRRCLNKVWNCTKHWELTPQLHKQLLIVLLERVLAHIEKPILWTDFLMDSLDKDGPIGVLALQGVYILVTKHNLEYPNIFTKLYSMFEPEIFHTKYKSRLFYLSDLFLSSSHLPEALVAAFAKRLSRLTLVAPPEDISIILMLVGNLILRHPGLKRMIDHPQGQEMNEGAGGDPFLMEERDPLLSNALQSSLWEIKSQQCHILPSIATAARFVQEPLPSVEYDMARALERTSGYTFDRELKVKVKDIMLAFERPNSMASIKGERILQYWHLTAMH